MTDGGNEGEQVELEPLLDESERNKLPAWAWWLFGIAAVVVIALVWLAIANSTDEENAPVPEPTVTASASPSPSPSPSESASPSVTPSDSPTPMPSPTDVPSEEPSDSPTPMPSPTDVPTPPSTFTNGVFVGGTDVEAGTYRTAAALAGGKCVWAVSGIVDGDPSTTPPIGTPAGGIPTVTLDKGATLVTKGCGTWEIVDPSTLFENGSAKAVLTDGVWLVGEDVRPGTYQTQPIAPGTIPEKLCRWIVGDDVASNFSTVDARGVLVEGAGTVTLEAGQQIESINCGDWIALSK